MTDFREQNDEAVFSRFVESHGGTYFQLPAWARVKSNWHSRCLFGYQNGEPVLSAMILSRHLPLCGTLWYIPCGFVGNYEDTQLLADFTDFLRVQMKKERVFAAVIDPPIPERIDGQEISAAKPVTEDLKALGWRHNPDPNNYTYQPTMTVLIECEDENGLRYTPDSLCKKFEKGVRYSVRVGEGRGLRSQSFTFADAERDPSLFDRFLEVMEETADRLEILARPRDYYYSFLREFAPYAVVDLVYYDKAADRENDRARLARLSELHAQINREERESIRKKWEREKEALEKDHEAFKARLKEADSATPEDRLTLAAGLTITFGDTAGCVFGGTRNILRNTLRSSHYLNFIRIARSLEGTVRYHDLGRVPHSYVSPKSPEHGLYQFKMSFCAKRYEYIGEYTLVSSRLCYFNYYRLMPLVRRYRMRVIRFFKNLFSRQKEGEA